MKPCRIELERILECPELYQIKSLMTLPGLGHCLTGRGGGVSRDECASLNLSFSAGDDPERVKENRRRVFTGLGLKAERIFFQHQVHGDRVTVVPEEWPQPSPYNRVDAVPETDALITTRPQTCLVGLAADCLLVGLYDPIGCAVAVVHAGWRSTIKGLVAKTVMRLTELTGSSPLTIKAFFSPSAGPCCYEVGPELLEEAHHTGWIKAEHFHPISNRGSEEKENRFRLDLWLANVWQLNQCGLSPHNIVNPALCTICHQTQFFSYRALGKNTGGHALLIWLTDGAVNTETF
ncbi:peptidoglycan editing factor PgeF [bacterium]|nr:peptidoglycan editing factor PgeF [bacterium]